jgi:hypothetical protein
MAVKTHRERRDFGPVELSEHLDFSRADLEIYGINHFRPSYTAHVYLNAPASGELEVSHDSYAGSFSIFGHGRCYGSEGHCEAHSHIRRFDDRPSHPLTRAFKRVVITEALRRTLQTGTRQLTVTFVVVAPDEDLPPGREPVLDFQGLQVTTFD